MMNIKNNKITPQTAQPILMDKPISANDILISGNSFESVDGLRETFPVKDGEKVQGIRCAVSEGNTEPAK